MLVLAPAQEKKDDILETDDVIRVKVLADVRWTHTGIEVREGEEFRFAASGGISLQKGNPMAYCDPDGYKLKTVQQPLPDWNIGALIGRVVHLVSVEIDEETGEEVRNEVEEKFYIGSENRVKMPLSGHLFLGINENVVDDNSGQYEVKMYRVAGQKKT